MCVCVEFAVGNFYFTKKFVKKNWTFATHNIEMVAIHIVDRLWMEKYDGVAWDEFPFVGT